MTLQGQKRLQINWISFVLSMNKLESLYYSTETEQLFKLKLLEIDLKLS